MGTRESSAVNRVLLVVLWLGMAGFVLLHSFLLFHAGGEQTRALVRLTWFAGLAIVAAILAYVTVRGRSTGLV